MAQEHLQLSTSFLDSAMLRLVKHMFMACLSQMEVVFNDIVLEVLNLKSAQLFFVEHKLEHLCL